MSKKRTQVTVLTKHYRIEGEIDLIPGARMTDFMNKVGKFMVVTEAVVKDLNDKELVTVEFINVRVNNIEVILPVDSAVWVNCS